MTASSDFDALYAATWRPLLFQTFAFCGDLGTAREASSDADRTWPRSASCPATGST